MRVFSIVDLDSVTDRSPIFYMSINNLAIGIVLGSTLCSIASCQNDILSAAVIHQPNSTVTNRLANPHLNRDPDLYEELNNSKIPIDRQGKTLPF